MAQEIETILSSHLTEDDEQGILAELEELEKVNLHHHQGMLCHIIIIRISIVFIIIIMIQCALVHESRVMMNLLNSYRFMK